MINKNIKKTQKIKNDMKKFIIITIVSLTAATGILSSQTTVKKSATPEAVALAPSTSGFRKDLGQAD
jgi:hypothetical protein